MDKRPPTPPPPDVPRLASVALGVVLFAAAAVLVIVAVGRGESVFEPGEWGIGLFFLVYGLFTITMGYPHPSYGHVSFDRVAQVSSILVLGPLPAALINGLASLLYPWHRLASRAPLRAVITASLTNAGLMAIMVLVCGHLYVALGGPVPLMAFDLRTVGLLVLLMLSMQVVNDIGMLVAVHLRGGDVRRHLNLFSTMVELSSVIIAILVAVIFNRMEAGVFVLLLWVLSLGMLVLKQFATMRNRLEALVAERTQALQEKSAELERQATRDKLTRLYNRRYADDFLDRSLEDARRHDHPFSIALADIDYFKEVNDRHSHSKGDAVLVRVAQILKDRCRSTDVIARYGGEEFLLCFPMTDAATAAMVCEELRQAIERDDWSFVAPDMQLTLSFGLAQYGEGQSRNDLFAVADQRLYAAKHNGRNQVVAED